MSDSCRRSCGLFTPQVARYLSVVPRKEIVNFPQLTRVLADIWVFLERIATVLLQSYQCHDPGYDIGLWVPEASKCSQSLGTNQWV